MSARAIAMLVPQTVPRIKAGDDLAGLILTAFAADGIRLQPGDIVVVAQKIVSKAEGRQRDLTEIVPSQEARDLADKTAKDARLMEVVLQESTEVLRARRDVCIVEHRLGHIMANAGIDHSNLAAPAQGDDQVLLLPEDPDRSARGLRQRFEVATSSPIGVIVSDSFGRPWRIGSTGVAIGTAGPAAVIDRRGETDLFGRQLVATEIAFADALAAAAVLVMGEAAEGSPVVVIRGLDWTDTSHRATDVLRPKTMDMFR